MTTEPVRPVVAVVAMTTVLVGATMIAWTAKALSVYTPAVVGVGSVMMAVAVVVVIGVTDQTVPTEG